MRRHWPHSEGEVRPPDQSGPFKRRPAPLHYPAYGAVAALVGFAVFYLVVDALMPTLSATVAEVLPGIVPDPFTTLVALLLWGLLGLAVIGIILEQTKDNPREFETTMARDAFLDKHRPTRSAYALSLVLLVAGGVTAAIAWPTFIDVLEAMVPVVTSPGDGLPDAVTLERSVVFVGFLLGFAAFSWSLDRLVIGRLREFLYRRHTDW